MKAQCPTCNSPLDIESLVEDTSARETFKLIGQQPAAVQGFVIPYLQLFKPRSQGLRWSRAQHLVQTLIDETAGSDPTLLAAALSETVAQLSEQRRGDNWRPLTKHNYLLRVLESQSAKPSKTLTAVNAPRVGSSKTAQAVNFLSTYSTKADVPDWFSKTVCEGLRSLYIASLDGTPAADMIEITADRWIDECWPRRKWLQGHRFIGERSLEQAFAKTANTASRWPAIEDVVGQVPRV